ncbi:MAG: ABC transporter ATP-binding protein, partial [Phycisphaerae bacterium]|nr:ABC transporter ATP-binding protein [Phycisphaerae bacterium]
VLEYLEFFAACYGIHGKKRQQVVHDVLELTDLTYKANSEVNGLSRGMQQRLSVARVLLHDPKVLLMDEPNSGLDPRARIEMRELLRELRRMGKTIIISSHILPELAELCTAVGIIEQGKLVYAGPMSDIMSKASAGSVVHIVVEDRHDQAAELLKSVRGIVKVQLADGDGRTRIEVTLDPKMGIVVSEIPSRLIAQGFRISAMHEERVNLETAFMKLTKGIVS